MNTDDSAFEPRRFWILLIAVTALAAGLRVLWLDRPSFWIDELYSVMHASRFGDGNISKQLGYMPTWLALKLAGALPGPSLAEQPEAWRAMGVTETLVRMPSVVIGVATVLWLGWLARGVVGARAALWFALLMAVSVWNLHMSQTGRFYAQQMLFYNAALLLYLRATTLGSIGRLVGSMACLVLSFLSQPLALVIGAVLGIDWLLGLRGRDPRRLTLPAAIAGGITAAACVGVLVIDMTRQSEAWGQFADNASQSAPTIVLGMVWIVGPAAALAAAWGLVSLLSTNRRLAVFLALGAAMPVAVMAGLALTGTFVHLRYAFVALPAWLLLAAVGIARLGDTGSHALTRIGALAAGGLVICASLLQCFEYYTSGGGYRPAWREAAAYIREHRKPGDRIIADNHGAWHTRYELGDPSPKAVQGPLIWDLLDSESTPAWVIDKGGAGGGMTWPALRERADLRWYWDRRITQPFSTVKVFLYEPPRR
jgi:hypothetical protein